MHPLGSLARKSGTGILLGCLANNSGAQQVFAVLHNVINVVFWTVSLVPASFAVWDVQDVKTYEDSQESGVEDVVVEPVDEKKNGASRV